MPEPLSKEKRDALYVKLVEAFDHGRTRETIYPALEKQIKQHGQIIICTLLDEAEDGYRTVLKRRAAKTDELHIDLEQNLHPPSPSTPAPQIPSSLPPADDMAASLEAAILARVEQLDNEYGNLKFSTEELDDMERWLKMRITDRALAAFNESFRKQQRRQLTYQELAVLALIHSASVRENDGHSPHKRFTAFSQSQQGLLAPISSAHIMRVLDLLEIVGFTKLVQKHDAKRSLSAKYILTS